LCNAIYSIGDSIPEIKEELDPLISELTKEPVVHSLTQITGERSIVCFTLNAFILHLERRYELEHILNEAILTRFREEEIKLL
jgi:hypothetical protein